MNTTKRGDPMEDIIVIVGPTGVGKTKLSIELAKKLNGEIINADSVSIYKNLNIGSAKPTKEEQQEVPHHLLDIKEVDEDYSVFDYQKDARKKIEEIQKRKKRVIIVGGTGLYIKSALYDYRFTEGTTYHKYEDLTNEEILSKIKSINKEINIHINNRKRLVRMLNKLENEEEITNNKNKVLYPIKIIGLKAEREELYQRINKRVDQMIEDGLLEEINALKKYYASSRILNSAIGYKEFKDFQGEKLEEVLEEIKKNSRHYAKRQYTFFRHQMNVNWFDIDFHHFDNTINQVLEFLKN